VTVRDEHYWVGNLAMTVALASKSPEPQKILRPALRDFLADRPAGDRLAAAVRDELKGTR
jgi:hypothetical protein